MAIESDKRKSSVSNDSNTLVRVLGRALVLRDSIGELVKSEEAQILLKHLEYEIRIAVQILLPGDETNSERLGRIASGS